MQSLLEDPVFYNLLVTNSESIRSSTSSQGSSSSSSDNNNGNINNNTSIIKKDNNSINSKIVSTTESDELKDLNLFEFPTISSNSQFMNSTATTCPSEASYESSIFSSNNTALSMDNLDHFNMIESFDDYFSKNSQTNNPFQQQQQQQQQQFPFTQQQINSQFNNVQFQSSQIHSQQQAYPIVMEQQSIPPPPPQQQQQKPQVDFKTEQQKHFHKFYTEAKATRMTMVSKPLHHAPASLNNKIQKFSPPSSTTTSSSITPSYHKCPFCQRQFKSKSYLSRHLKKHDTVKDFKCPFFDEVNSKCHHLNGEFSRKDTFKAHLKSIHFIYPVGVFKCDRNLSIGRCAGCFKEFQNNNDWLVKHIDVGECPGFAKIDSIKQED